MNRDGRSGAKQLYSNWTKDEANRQAVLDVTKTADGKRFDAAIVVSQACWALARDSGAPYELTWALP